jgi:hypothetical protein
LGRRRKKDSRDTILGFFFLIRSPAVAAVLPGSQADPVAECVHGPSPLLPLHGLRPNRNIWPQAHIGHDISAGSPLRRPAAAPRGAAWRQVVGTTYCIEQRQAGRRGQCRQPHCSNHGPRAAITPRRYSATQIILINVESKDQNFWLKRMHLPVLKFSLYLRSLFDSIPEGVSADALGGFYSLRPASARSLLGMRWSAATLAGGGGTRNNF